MLSMTPKKSNKWIFNYMYQSIMTTIFKTDSIFTCVSEIHQNPVVMQTLSEYVTHSGKINSADLIKLTRKWQRNYKLKS